MCIEFLKLERHGFKNPSACSSMDLQHADVMSFRKYMIRMLPNFGFNILTCTSTGNYGRFSTIGKYVVFSRENAIKDSTS
jgi:hypothetical protein